MEMLHDMTNLFAMQDDVKLLYAIDEMLSLGIR